MFHKFKKYFPGGVMEILEYLEQIAYTTSQDALKISSANLPKDIQRALQAKDSSALKEILGKGQPLADMVRVV